MKINPGKIVVQQGHEIRLIRGVIYAHQFRLSTAMRIVVIGGVVMLAAIAAAVALLLWLKRDH